MPLLRPVALVLATVASLTLATSTAAAAPATTHPSAPADTVTFTWGAKNELTVTVPTRSTDGCTDVVTVEIHPAGGGDPVVAQPVDTDPRATAFTGAVGAWTGREPAYVAVDRAATCGTSHGTHPGAAAERPGPWWFGGLDANPRLSSAKLACPSGLERSPILQTHAASHFHDYVLPTVDPHTPMLVDHGELGVAVESSTSRDGWSVTLATAPPKDFCGNTVRGPDPYVPPATSAFIDVRAPQQFAKEIAWMASAGISTGYRSGSSARYLPLEPVERGAMAAFLYRAAGSPAFTPPAATPFADVAPNHPFYREITWLYAEGISTGWVENRRRTFRPDASIKRDAMAVFLYRWAGRPAFDVPVRSPFTDLSPRQDFYAEMTWLASTGVSTGWAEANGTSTFRALEPIRRDAMAAFLFRVNAR